jgi:putative transposase
MEMAVFLGKPEQVDNKRNGFKVRDYTLKNIGTVRFKMPCDRKSEFQSALVPKSERIDPRLKEDMGVLHLAGLSTRTLSMMSKRLLGVELSADSVTKSLDSLIPKAQEWLVRPIEDEYWALYIDGTNFKVQRAGTTEREPSLCVLGVSKKTNKKSILAIESGSKDNAECWRTVFDSLKERGLKASSVEIGIMDGLPGLEKVFKDAFPQAVTARCWIHALKNALNKSPQRFRDLYKSALLKVMYAPSESEARVSFRALKESFQETAPKSVACIEKDLESLLTHYRFKQEFWIALKTTNSIERINKEFKRRTKAMGTVGAKTLDAVLAFTALRLEMGWHFKAINEKSSNEIVWRNLKTKDKKSENSLELATQFLNGALN